ncbi:P-loop containing nucleoside triphosphate hydrolase protein [Cubamyces sp. BRFM 1775]|nr:P-loop containing nucleoside triphosphate hydrolase protein [Cubamyces sp. BRFM 1775]
MPRIRKKTSRRVSLAHRAKVQKKVKEAHRKQKRDARKNPPKKSKPKDPGIPNAFPYKDQILAEVAEQRRQAAEEKQRRKEEKKAAQAAQAGEGSDASGDEGDVSAFDGVRALNASARPGPVEESGDEAMDEAEEEVEDEDAPMLVNPDLPNLKAVLDAADVVVEVLDARDPLAARSAHVEEIAREGGKRVLLVLNKVDACPKEAVEAWATTLRKEHPTVLFRSASACLPAPAESVKGKGKERVDDAWGLEAVLALFKQWVSEKKDDKPLTIAVVGVTNAGKSSFVNSLLRKAVLQTYRLTSTPSDSPTTTSHPQEVTLELDNKQVRLIDTPGLSWQPVEDASEEDRNRTRAKDVLLRSRGRIERMKDPSFVLSELVSRANREDLMLMYNLPIFTEGDANAFLAGVARANGFVKKRGEPDLTGASRLVLRDWANGKLARYTVPPTPSSDSGASTTDSTLAEVYSKDQAVLSKLSTRKELRKAGGLVRIRPGSIDARKPTLDASYFVASDDEGNESDVEEGAELDESEDDDDEEDVESYASEEIDELDSDEDEEDEEEAPSPPSGKRKRAAAKSAAPARPAKKVAFAAEPKGTKQARSAAAAKGAAAAKAKSKPTDDKAAKKPAKASALKKAATAEWAKAAPVKKVANSAASRGGKKSAASAAKEDEEAYDFKQFF